MPIRTNVTNAVSTTELAEPRLWTRFRISVPTNTDVMDRIAVFRNLLGFLPNLELHITSYLLLLLLLLFSEKSSQITKSKEFWNKEKNECRQHYIAHNWEMRSEIVRLEVEKVLLWEYQGNNRVIKGGGTTRGRRTESGEVVATSSRRAVKAANSLMLLLLLNCNMNLT